MQISSFIMQKKKENIMQIKCEKCYAVSDAAMPETYLEGEVELNNIR